MARFFWSSLFNNAELENQILSINDLFTYFLLVFNYLFSIINIFLIIDNKTWVHCSVL